MTAIAAELADQLNDDLLSHGWIVQCVNEANGRRSGLELHWKDVVGELLSAEIEIGDTRIASPRYVEFVAWRGTISQRIVRAEERVKNSLPSDREFAYWLCLRKNVDRYEGD
jgi:hypothetical protein